MIGTVRVVFTQLNMAGIWLHINTLVCYNRIGAGSVVSVPG